MMQILLENRREISAIYYALLHVGYEHYAQEKDAELARRLDSFRGEKADFDLSFWRGIRQNTCEVYPYWPRAALLEQASFFLNREGNAYADFDAYHREVMAAGNLSAVERNQDFWTWVRDFPASLSQVMASQGFARYFAWECEWTQGQRARLNDQITQVEARLNACLSAYDCPAQRVHILLCATKCAYSADYKRQRDSFYYISGRFRLDSVVHELLHTAIHPRMEAYRTRVEQHTALYPGIDKSYYASGRLNAFEEYCVAGLTREVLNGEVPPLAAFLDSCAQESRHK